MHLIDAETCGLLIDTDDGHCNGCESLGMRIECANEYDVWKCSIQMFVRRL